MNVIHSSTLAGTRRRPLAVCLASVFSLSAPATVLAAATVWPVTTCNESGAGSIRAVIGAVTTVSGDTVDLSGLTACPSSKISLTTGEIFVPQASLTITGPGASVLKIDATGNAGGAHGPFTSRVFTHTGIGGTLTVQSLTLTGGHAVRSGYPALGGCIYSAGNVELDYAGVTGCYTYEYGTYGSSGGGVYTTGNLRLKNSTLTNNHATATSTVPYGGGAFVIGNISVEYSTVSGNTATSGQGGGIYVRGSAGIFASTISGNSANIFGGIMAYSPTPGENIFGIVNSTVSGNTATTQFGAMYINSGRADFYNSTIAFNTAPHHAGVTFGCCLSPMAVTLQSMLMSNNGGSSGDSDLIKFVSTNVTINGGDTVTPANNLIRASDFTLPGDTIHSCPLLGPLRDNGGLTQTHALGSRSPAIDKGNMVGGPGVQQFDQRGRALTNGVRDYLRSGPIGDNDPPVADIGAYEVQQNDEIFQAFFEGCNPLPG